MFETSERAVAGTRPFAAAPPASPLIFPIKASSAVFASVLFGLVAARTFDQWSFWVAVGFGFLFGTCFVAGTGYRILLAAWHRELRGAATSWSGATAASALGSAVGFALLAANGFSGAHLLLAFALAINLAYLLVKFSCMLAGCCGRAIRTFGQELDLRHVEIGCTTLVLALAGTIGAFQPDLGASLGIVGHIILRLFSRSKRGRPSLGWPPLRQPGAELAPLYLVLALALSTSG